jgi:hypothetical protein
MKDGNAVGDLPDIEAIMEIGVRPLRPKNSDNNAFGQTEAEPAQHKTEEHSASDRPWGYAECSTNEVCDGLGSLAPVPTPCGDSPRFRDDIGEFFVEIAKNRLRLIVRSKQLDKPTG